MNLTCIAVGASALAALSEIMDGRVNIGVDLDWLRIRMHYVGSDTFDRASWAAVFADIPESDMVVLDLMGAEKEFVEALQQVLQGFEGSVVVVNASSRKIRSVARLGSFSGSMMGGGTPRRGSGNMMRMLERIEKLGKAVPVGPLRDLRNYLWIGKYWHFANRGNLTSLLTLIGREYGGRRGLPRPEAPKTIDRAILMIPDSDRLYDSFDAYREAEGWVYGRPGVAVLFSPGTYPANLHPATAKLVSAMNERFNVLPFAMPRLTGASREFFESIVRDASGTLRVDAVVNLMGFRLGQGPMGGAAEEATGALTSLNLPLLHPFFIAKRSIDTWREDVRGIKPGEFVLHLFLPELDGAFETIPIGALEADAGDGLGRVTLIEDRVDRLIGKIEGIARLRRTPNREKRVALIMYDYPPGEASLGAAAFLNTFESVAALSRALARAGYDTEPWAADELRETLITGGVVNGAGFTGASGGVEVDGGVATSLPDAAATQVRGVWGRPPGRVMVRHGKIVLPVVERGNCLVGLQPSRTGDVLDAASYHDTGSPPHHQYVAFYRWLEQEWHADAVIHIGTHGTLEFLPGKEVATSESCLPDALPGSVPHFYFYYCGNPAESMIAKRRSHAVMLSHMEPPYTLAESHGRLVSLKSLLSEYHEASRTDPDRVPEVEADIQAAAEEAGLRARSVSELEDQLLELSTALIPSRMHTIGRPFSSEEAEALAAQVRAISDDQILGQDDALAADGGSGQPIDTELVTVNREIESFLHALNGGYIEAGPAGDLTRTPEVAPTGRNMYQFDPRKTPTPSAIRRGTEIAENTLRQYVAEHGAYPSSVAVVLWGLETTKTHGETVAQIMRYLGVQFGQDRGLWETDLELIPTDELGRPRVDVTIQMSGFFRDLFPNLISVLHDAVDLAASADEGQNVIAEHAATIRTSLLASGVEESVARDLSTARLFGPQTAEYGTGLTGVVSSSTWTNETDLVSHYQDRLKYVYSRNYYGVAQPELLSANLSQVQMVSQVRSSRDYEMTDLDHFYEFYGGLARTVKELSGSQADLLVSDTYEGRVRTERLHRAVERGVWSRLLNPRWIDGVLDAAHHGGQEIADRFENMLGLAATTGEVDTKLFDEASDILVFNETTRRRIRENNPYALLEVVERLLETSARGYWQASEDRLSELHRIHAELEGDLEAGSETPQREGTPT